MYNEVIRKKHIITNTNYHVNKIQLNLLQIQQDSIRILLLYQKQIEFKEYNIQRNNPLITNTNSTIATLLNVCNQTQIKIYYIN